MLPDLVTLYVFLKNIAVKAMEVSFNNSELIKLYSIW